jgi:uncharacterized protein
MAAALGRDARSLWHPLDVLQAGGFVRRSEDVLTRRRPVYTVSDPIVRFSTLVVRPRQQLFEERRAETAWQASRSAFSARVLGPHFEQLAREWTGRTATAATLGGSVGITGQAVVNDPAGRAQHELDVVALAEGEPLHPKHATIRAIGEAKATTRPRGTEDLARLERIRSVLGERGHDIAATRLLLFSRTGFTTGLVEAERVREDVELVDLARLYHGE